jgi:hypothetical protein
MDKSLAPVETMGQEKKERSSGEERKERERGDGPG